MRVFKVKQKRGFAFLGLLLGLLIASFIFWKLINFYFKKPSVNGVNKETQNTLSEQGLDTSYKSVLDASRDTVRQINEQAINRAEGTEAATQR